MEEKKMLNVDEVRIAARNMRQDIIKAISAAGSGHPGGSLSAADILATLYFYKMNVDPENPDMTNRDKFVLSKGHAAPALYAALGRKGFFDVEEMYSLRKIGSIFQGHPDMKKIPGVEMSTGSLGQGFSTAVGMAIANKLDGRKSKVYVLLGDGEIQEGIVWEAAMSAAHYKLDNIVAILDNNGLQIDGRNDDVMKVAPIYEKFESFGWEVMETDGHDIEEIAEKLDAADEIEGKPVMIIARTVKGKGVSFMEDEAGWHGKAPNAEETEKALAELGGEQ
ncbi:MAG: transketolase [Firmicutes bacterium]|nr:transketolase [Bacillota bacterium]